MNVQLQIFGNVDKKSGGVEKWRRPFGDGAGWRDLETKNFRENVKAC